MATGQGHLILEVVPSCMNLTVCTAEVAGLRSHAHKS